MMKRFLLLIICCTTISLCAEARTREPYKPKSEITVRWGMDQGVYGSWFNNWDYWNDSPWNTPLERYNNGRYYRDYRIYTQALSISYTREIKRWLALSLNASFSGEYQNIKDRDAGNAIYKYKRFRLGIVPMVRFTYFNRPAIRLYSAIGLGIGTRKTKYFYDDDYYYETYITGQITAFGVSVGKRWFGTWEVGYGTMGYLVMGTGYRF